MDQTEFRKLKRQNSTEEERKQGWPHAHPSEQTPATLADYGCLVSTLLLALLLLTLAFELRIPYGLGAREESILLFRV